MTHTNCSLQKPNEVTQWLNVEKLETELKFWRSQAEHLTAELENIPRALREYGEWQITAWGETTHVILDPEHHAPTLPPNEGGV